MKNLLLKNAKMALKTCSLIICFISLSIFVFACGSTTQPVAPVVTPLVTSPTLTPTPIPEINTNSTTAKEIIVDMGGGFNLGNVYDNGINASNVATNKAIIDLYYGAGSRHVRIPTTWVEGFSSNIADGNGKINTSHPRFLELKETIDYALAKKMYVVLNTHHERWLKNNYDGSAAFDNKFGTLWSSIATFFKDYPKQLMFDILNEPEGKLGQWGNSYPTPINAQQLTWTRQVNKVGYDAIRATGGNNATRVIMVEPNGQGNQGMIDKVYPNKESLPGAGKDAYIAFQVHSYDPWAFCGETGTLGAYPGDATIINAMKTVNAHSILVDVPVNYGEFGVGRKSNTEERNTEMVRGLYKLYSQTCRAQKMSFTPWDDRGWFGLVNGSGTNFTFTANIVPTMMAQ